MSLFSADSWPATSPPSCERERGSKHPTEAELQRAVGDRIRVRLHLSEFVTGKR